VRYKIGMNTPESSREKKGESRMRQIVEVISTIDPSLILFENQSWSSESISIGTEDQKRISATYYPPPAPNASAVILIPDARCDGSVFGGFASKVSKAGFAVLAMDLRYKDLIRQSRSVEENIRLLRSQGSYVSVNYEVKSAIDFLGSQKKVKSNKIALLGTSYGSRVAPMDRSSL
jgi:dienelactone hydrolase